MLKVVCCHRIQKEPCFCLDEHEDSHHLHQQQYHDHDILGNEEEEEYLDESTSTQINTTTSSSHSSNNNNNNNNTPPPIPPNKPKLTPSTPSDSVDSSSSESSHLQGTSTTTTTTTVVTTTASANSPPVPVKPTRTNRRTIVDNEEGSSHDHHSSSPILPTQGSSTTQSPTVGTVSKRSQSIMRSNSGGGPNHRKLSQQIHHNIHDDGQFRYMYVPPHRLVYTIETHVRMLPNDYSYEEESKQFEERAAENVTESQVEPFVGQLPLPPNCNLFKQALRYRNALEDLNSSHHHSHTSSNVSSSQQVNLNRRPSQGRRKQSLIQQPQGKQRKHSAKGSASTLPHGAVRHVQSVKDPFPEEIAGKGIPVRIGLSQSLSTSTSTVTNGSLNGHTTSTAQSQLPFTLQNHQDRLCDIPFPPYNSVNLYANSLNYVYEDHWQVEKSRPLLQATLVSPQIDDDRSKWRTRVLSRFPVMQELSERLYPLWRTISFGELFNAGRKEVRKNLKEEHVMNIIMQHLTFEGLKKTRAKLEEEAQIKYEGIDVDQSLLHALAKEAVKKSEKLMDTVICDKFSPAYIQKNKGKILKELDELLSLEFGINNDEFGSSRKRDEDVNIWKEPERQNEIVDFDPVNKSEHFQAGSLNKVIERLTMPTQDQQFIDIFLNTYMAITSPETVLAKLFQRFRVPSHFTPDVKNGVQSGVIRVLIIWLENHFHHFTNNMLQRIQSFLDEQAQQQAKINKSRKKINEIISQMRNKSNKPEEMQFRPSDKIPDPIIPLGKIFSPDLAVEDIDGEEMARQLCLYEFDMYFAIKSEELLNQAWTKPKLKHRATNVIAMMNFFENISLWVASLICRGKSTYERKHSYKKLIIICEHLRKLNNFNTLKAILNGFETGAVKRLKETRNELGNKSKEAETVLKQLMSEENNYKRYKEVLKQSSVPAIPYLGVHLQDLEYIEKNHHDFVKNTNRNGSELINWIKRESLSEVIKEIKHFQNPIGYKFVKVYQIQELIRNMPGKVPNQQSLMMLSYKAEGNFPYN
ncbi:hypothetical protein C9374_010459 [Naegleria lovaniensis]|uniref:RasGEF domain-containing protein n=1 Tax=Naegleria lovaniensis TaxID=51637 RepID=A0AA88GBM9_NAELO|nr:uncharacterized protein C9374_010459 [Naegleria lovaniensis]KAG2374715.1 hypothetical protein C9374_010459 [Naegleria lovaniensis]